MPTEINSIEDLDNVRNNLSGDYVLLRDLDFNDDASYDNPANKSDYTTGEGWVPIGDWTTQFSGTLDGQGFSISNLYVNDTGLGGYGLFGIVGDTTILHDFNLLNVSITGGDNDDYYIGSVFGGTTGGSFYNITSSGAVSGGLYGVGGFCGASDTSSSSFDNCHTSCSVTSAATDAWYVGGFAGYNYLDTIINCSASGNVIGSDDSGISLTGGFSGYLQTNNPVTGCKASGNVSATGDYVGGFAGEIDDAGVGLITDCYATGSVTTPGHKVGGFTGSITFAYIDRIYSTGSVSGDTDVGGLIGDSVSSTTTNSFWDTQTSGQATSDGGTGKTTSEMQDIDTFASWDITVRGQYDGEIWWIDDGLDYPRLSYEHTFAKLETLQDDFSGTELDTEKWTTFAPTQVAVNGQLELTVNTSYSGEVRSVDFFDFTDSYALVEVKDWGNLQEENDYWPLRLGDFDDDINWTQLIQFYFDGTLYAQYRTTEITTIVESEVARYNWYRIREGGGTVYWEVSNDGVAWTEFASVATPTDITALRVMVDAGRWDGVDTVFILDNFNVEPEVSGGNFLALF